MNLKKKTNCTVGGFESTKLKETLKLKNTNLKKPIVQTQKHLIAKNPKTPSGSQKIPLRGSSKVEVKKPIPKNNFLEANKKPADSRVRSEKRIEKSKGVTGTQAEDNKEATINISQNNENDTNSSMEKFTKAFSNPKNNSSFNYNQKLFTHFKSNATNLKRQKCEKSSEIKHNSFLNDIERKLNEFDNAEHNIESQYTFYDKLLNDLIPNLPMSLHVLANTYNKFQKYNGDKMMLLENKAENLLKENENLIAKLEKSIDALELKNKENNLLKRTIFNYNHCSENENPTHINTPEFLDKQIININKKLGDDLDALYFFDKVHMRNNSQYNPNSIIPKLNLDFARQPKQSSIKIDKNIPLKQTNIAKNIASINNKTKHIASKPSAASTKPSSHVNSKKQDLHSLKLKF